MDNERLNSRTTRSRVACSACRARKVRCDVVRQGSPCTNCFLDHKKCVVDVSLRSGRRRNADKLKQDLPKVPPIAHEVRTPEATATVVRTTQGAEKKLSEQGYFPVSTPPALLSLLQSHLDDADQELPPSGRGIRDINFSVYHFLRSDFLSALRQDDIKYLEDQTCLRVPQRELMDEMINQYFRHIQPLLPLFNETQFWATYQPVKYASLDPRPNSISLFVLQAMLFASCSFMPIAKLRWLGFTNTRHARKCLYRRAKLLYSLDTENNPLSLAQGALLLSLWCPRDNDRKINTWWLTVAIQHARAAQAHCYQEQRHLCKAGQLELKRLWWSCIIRDRVMALGLRQPIHITREAFDFEAGKLTVGDIKDEGEEPGVYRKELKRALATITIAMCDLCSVLTDIFTLTTPQVGSTIRISEHWSHLFLQVRRLRENLKAWHKDMTYHLSTMDAECCSHASVTLFSHLLLMYFNSALILLANYEVQLEVESQPPRGQVEVNIARNKLEVQESTISITELLQDLVRLDLVKYLPISAVTCTAQPLVLCLLDETLDQGATAVRHTKLGVVLEAMKVYQSLYDNTDMVLDTAHRISLKARSVVQDQEIMGWEDILVRNPKAYLRFINTMDVALCKGSFPNDCDLPSALQTKATPDDHQQNNRQITTEENQHSPASLESLTSNSNNSHGVAMDIPNTEAMDCDLRDPASEIVICSPWNDPSSRAPVFIESELFLQSLLEEYLNSDNDI